MTWKMYVLQLRNPIAKSCPGSVSGCARLTDRCTSGNILPASHLSSIGFHAFAGSSGATAGTHVLRAVAYNPWGFGSLLFSLWFIIWFMANAFLC